MNDEDDDDDDIDEAEKSRRKAEGEKKEKVSMENIMKAADAPWKNIRGPRPEEDNKEYNELMAELKKKERIKIIR